MLYEYPIQAEDLLHIEPQAEQAGLPGIINGESARLLVGQWPGRTVRDETGRIVLCCGAIPMHAQRMHVWAVLSNDASRHLPAVVKLVRGFVARLGARRTEMTIRSGFASGHKWARLLGFACEGRLRAYGENGEDHHLYAKIHHEHNAVRHES